LEVIFVLPGYDSRIGRGVDLLKRRAMLAAIGAATVVAALSIPGEAAFAATPLVLTWTQQSPAASPPVLESATMVYDPVTASTVLFGGQSNGVDQDATWIWDGTTWALASPAHVPPVRYGASMAFDAATGDVVLFGGSQTAGIPYLDDTWTWDGTDWTQQLPASSPPAGYGTSMAYDGASGSVVLFGGEDGVVDDSDTWTWDGTNWTLLAPAASPSPRYASAISYDAARGTIVLFGGVDLATSALLGDTWTWDGSTWAQQSPTTAPSARDFSTMGYDTTHQFAVLFGGSDAAGPLGDTWTWDGTDWTAYSSPTSPPRRLVAVSAFDQNTSGFVLFGGFGTADLGDTWLATFAAPAATPPVTADPAATLPMTGVSVDGTLALALALLLAGGAIVTTRLRSRARASCRGRHP
jgi:hypothetical protein